MECDSSSDLDGSTDGREIILEYRYLGNAVRVAAVDVESAIEVVFQAPAGSPQHAILALARRKLAARLNDRGCLARRDGFV